MHHRYTTKNYYEMDKLKEIIIFKLHAIEVGEV